VVGELERFAGWCVGLALVVVCGWGLIAFSLWLTQGYRRDMELAGSVAALLSLGLFLLLERNLWLSRIMGLRLTPNSVPWKEAVQFWLLGVGALFFRSTVAQAEAQVAAKGGRKPESQPVDSVREVVETIVFVVVLVLMLKSFAAEAFVIPTGSMAQTLWGYQKVVECPDCHLEFPVNCSSEVDPSDGRLESIYACTCPNCRQRMHFPNAPDWARDRFSVEVRDPGWNSGDRVLVGKFVYDLLQRDPDRLDVVVFKYPGDSNFPFSGPYKSNVPMNYIKRLIGLPGETIAVHRGNVYVLPPPEKGPRWDDYEQALKDPELFARLWQKEPYMHVNTERDRDLFRDGKFRIIRKDPDTLLAMMRLVFDNDHFGKGMAERWEGDPGWRAEGRGFRHDGKGEKVAWLHYSHLPNRANPRQKQLITDFMGYNTFANSSHRSPPAENWANDLVLECQVTVPDNPSGELTMELSRGVDRFRARWDLRSAEGRCTLFRVNGDKESQMGESKPTALKGKGTYRLRFANVDERLTVWVDGQLPFDQGATYLPPADEGPTEANDLEPASIGVRGAGVQVQKLKLFRDTYYTASASHPNEADASFDPGTPSSWKSSLEHLPVLTMYVQPDHYLCMGDNSPESSDGRSWGTVPKRLLLGRAVLVYYPFSRAGRIR
jgi:signal peptidase I